VKGIDVQVRVKTLAVKNSTVVAVSWKGERYMRAMTKEISHWPQSIWFHFLLQNKPDGKTLLLGLMKHVKSSLIIN
jgi:hypothetical protein